MDNSSVGDSFDVGSFECTLFQKLFLLANQQQTRIKMIVRGQVVLRLSPLPAPSPSRGRGRGRGGEEETLGNRLRLLLLPRVQCIGCRYVGDQPIF